MLSLDSQKKYSVHNLVWYELHDSMESAIKREKSIKNWKRQWKIKIIEGNDPHWVDLFHSIL